MSDLIAISLDSYEDPLSLLRGWFRLTGVDPIYLLPDPDGDMIVWASSEPFTVEDVRRKKEL